VFVSRDNPDFGTSLRFAELVGREMKAEGLQYARQYTQPIMGRYQHPLLNKETGVYSYDQLIVLRKARMPAALLEAGSIINRDEELKMDSPERQNIISSGVTAAVKEFCDLAGASWVRSDGDDGPASHALRHPVMKKLIADLIACAFALMCHSAASADAGLPKGLVYLSKVDPTIHQDMRYAGAHNFVGRPIAGYAAAECILSERAASALKAAQEVLAAKQLSLIVWDCYRPVQAVRDFLRWAADSSASQMKQEFFPGTNKALLFRLGYLASHSKHSRASTVDLGITPNSLRELPTFDPKATLVPCTEAQGVRFEDGTIDLGTGHDCLDVLVNVNAKASGARWCGTIGSISETSCDPSDSGLTIKSGGISNCGMNPSDHRIRLPDPPP